MSTVHEANPIHESSSSLLQKAEKACEWTGRKVKQISAPVQERVGKICGTVGCGAIYVAGHVATFVKSNWKTLLAYGIAWPTILTFIGFTCGFKAVAFPLAIGMSCGIAFGVLIGIATVKIFDRGNTFRGRNSAWGLLNAGIEYLDKNGTRQILLPVAVTVILATAIIFPYAVGAGIGIFLGNQLAVQTGYPADPLWQKKNELHEKVQEYKTGRSNLDLDVLRSDLDQLRIDISKERYEQHDLQLLVIALKEEIEVLELKRSQKSS